MEKPRIHFVYEIDCDYIWSTIAVKAITLNAEQAVATYDRLKRHYKGDPDYYLCVGYLEEAEKAFYDSNLLTDMQMIASTENEEE
mgnify:CR=1 FL=1